MGELPRADGSAPASFEVGPFRIEPSRNEVAGPDGVEKLEPRVMQVLVCLGARAGDVVSREQILEEVWQDRFVSDEVLTVAIQKLRRVLGDDAKRARFVQTVPGRGYRLNEVSHQPESATSPSSRASRGTLLAGARALVAVVVVVAVVALVLVARDSPMRRDNRPPPRRIAIDPPLDAVAESFVISPDGTRLAFVAPIADGVDSVWVRELESGSSKVLAGTENVWRLFWSPDSLAIAFSTPSQLKRVSLSGGSPETLSEMGVWGGGAWSDDEIMLLSDDAGQLRRMAAQGGEATPLVLEDGLGPDVDRMFPFFLPDGTHFLYFAIRTFGRGRIYVGSLESTESVFVVESDSKAIYSDGLLLFVRRGMVQAQAFDADRLELRGEPKALGAQLMSAEVFGGQDTSLSVSRNGILALRGGSAPAGQLVWFDRDGNELSRIPEPESGEYVNPSLSHDGRTIAVNRRDPATGNLDIWLIDAETNRASRFTTDVSPEADLVWSPAGDRVVYGAYREGRHGVWMQPAAGGAEELLWEGPPGEVRFGVIPRYWSRGDVVLVNYTQFPFQSWAVPVSGQPEPWAIFDSEHYDMLGELSPSQNWIAYSSNETGNFEVYVRRFPGLTDKKRVSLAGGTHPEWRQDGKELFFWGGTNRIASVIRVDVVEDAESSTLELGVPEPVFAHKIIGFLDGRSNYTVTPDGQRFLLRRPSLDPPPVTLIIDWTAELELR